MLKTIPKSNITKRSFPVYKEWVVDNTQYPVISASLEDGLFDNQTSNQQNGIYTHPLYKSLSSKYYNQTANPFTIFGSIDNIADISNERKQSDTFYVISLPQNLYGEKIKPNSISLTDTDSGVIYSDDGHGNIVSDKPLYTLVSIDFQTQEVVISDSSLNVFNGTILSFDVNTGVATMTFGSDTDNVLVVVIDLEQGTITTAVPLDFDGVEIAEARFGNIFYSDGILSIINLNSFSNYILNYRSTKTIHETEILVSSRAGEFNYSQNPSAVVVTLSGSYDFQTTAVTNSSPAGTIKIKEVLDIKRKESFVGTYSSSISGSWDDYYNSGSVDPTGSYLTTYITTIGLYDNDGDMVAIAKLPKPIKNLPDYDVNFIVRFDT